MKVNVKFELSAYHVIELMCDYMGQESGRYSKKRFLNYAKSTLENYGLYFQYDGFNQDKDEPILEAIELLDKYSIYPKSELLKKVQSWSRFSVI